MLLSLQVKEQSVRIHATGMDWSVTTHNTVMADWSSVSALRSQSVWTPQTDVFESRSPVGPPEDDEVLSVPLRPNSSATTSFLSVRRADTQMQGCHLQVDSLLH